MNSVALYKIVATKQTKRTFFSNKETKLDIFFAIQQHFVVKLTKW